MKRVNISQVDALFSDGSYAIEFVFYYQAGLDTKRLRRALRRLSSTFWPMFGEYRDGVISFDKYREDDIYAEEASGEELDTREIQESGFEVCSRFGLPEFRRLFFLKAVRFKNGTLLIPKLKHLAGDGYSYFYFLSLLAALTQGGRLSLKSSLARLLYRPHHRRTILRDFSFRGAPQKTTPQDDRFTLALEEVPRAEVRSLIKEAAASDNLRISSNDVLSAMSLKKLVSIQGESWGESAGLTMPIDVRPQIKEYGRRFFGNGIMLHRVELRREQVENSPVKDIALKIRASMPVVSKATFLDYLTGLEETLAGGRPQDLSLYDPGRGCLVTNLSRLPSERLDFGTGPPELVLPLTTGRNAAAILARQGNYVLRFAY